MSAISCSCAESEYPALGFGTKFRGWGLGFEFEGWLWFGVEYTELGVWVFGSGFRVRGLRFRCLAYGVEFSGLRFLVSFQCVGFMCYREKFRVERLGFGG
jgi:hypothetical protein